MKNQKKIGVGISYVNIALSMFSHLIFIPMLLNYLTDETYSIYKVMQTFAGPVIMFNMGLATVVTRCIARYRTFKDGEKEEAERRSKENTLALSLIISVIMTSVVIIIGLVMMGLIDNIFAKTIQGDNVFIAKSVFIIFIISTAMHIIDNVFSGTVMGNERFIFYYGILVAQHIIRFSFILIAIKLEMDVIAISMVDLIAILIKLFAEIFYVKFSLHERFKLYKIEKAELVSIFTFAVSIFLQAIINQVNNNLDVVILGATITNEVTINMYSLALSIVATYTSLLSVFLYILLPNAVMLVTKKVSSEKLTDFAIKSSRMQVAIAVLVLGGFVMLGRDFVSLWIGDQYSDAYAVTLVLMFANTLPLVQNICISILDAKLKRLFRSVLLALMALFNVITSLIMINYIGYWGAAMGTALSIIIGEGIIMNIYYHKVIGLNVIRMFKETFKGYIPAIALSLLCSLPLLWLPCSWLWLVIKVFVFVAIYGIWVWLIGLNKSEKQYVFEFINKVKRK